MGQSAGLSLTTSSYNIFLGYEAGKNRTSGNGNILIGDGTNSNSGSGNINVGIGRGVFAVITTGSNNTAIGASAGNALTTGSDNWIIGGASSLTTGSNNVTLGNSAGQTLATGSKNTFIGANTSGTSANIGAIALGYGAITTGDNQMVIGGSQGSGAYINDLYIGSGVTDTTAQNIIIHGTGGSGTDNAGGNLTLAAGISTGTASPKNVFLQTTNAIATGTTAQTLTTVAQTKGLEDYMAFEINRGLIESTTVLTDASYDASTAANLDDATVNYVFPTLTGAVSFTLPDITDVAFGTTYTIKDGVGSAGTYNITVTASGTDVIDGAATYVMNTNYDSVTVVAWGDIGGNYWMIK